MHPKQIPSIIASSMMLVLVIMATISAAVVDWYLVVVGGTFVTALIGIMLGRFVPKPYDNSINDLVISQRTLLDKVNEIRRNVDVSPFALQNRHDETAKSFRRMEKALAMLLAKNEIGPHADPERHEE